MARTRTIRLFMVPIIIFLGLAIALTYTREFELDLNSGKTGKRYRVLGIQIHHRVIDTNFSHLISQAGIERSSPRWLMVNSWSLFTKKSGTGGWLHAGLRDLVQLMEMYDVPVTTQSEVAVEVLKYLEAGRVIRVDVENDQLTIMYSDRSSYDGHIIGSVPIQ